MKVSKGGSAALTAYPISLAAPPPPPSARGAARSRARYTKSQFPLRQNVEDALVVYLELLGVHGAERAGLDEVLAGVEASSMCLNSCYLRKIKQN